MEWSILKDERDEKQEEREERRCYIRVVHRIYHTFDATTYHSALRHSHPHAASCSSPSMLDARLYGRSHTGTPPSPLLPLLNDDDDADVRRKGRGKMQSCSMLRIVGDLSPPPPQCGCCTVQSMCAKQLCLLNTDSSSLLLPPLQTLLLSLPHSIPTLNSFLQNTHIHTHTLSSFSPSECIKRPRKPVKETSKLSSLPPPPPLPASPTFAL